MRHRAWTVIGIETGMESGRYIRHGLGWNQDVWYDMGRDATTTGGYIRQCELQMGLLWTVFPAWVAVSSLVMDMLVMGACQEMTCCLSGDWSAFWTWNSGWVEANTSHFDLRLPPKRNLVSMEWSYKGNRHRESTACSSSQYACIISVYLFQIHTFLVPHLLSSVGRVNSLLIAAPGKSLLPSPPMSTGGVRG